MRALLVGSGAVGLGIGASLVDSGWQMDIVARGKTKEAIEKKGIVRQGLFKKIDISPERITVCQTIGDFKDSKYDFILICSKTTVSSEIAEELWNYKHILRDQGKIVLFQNGFGIDEPFLKFFEKHQLFLARVITGFSRPELNISEVTVHAAPVLIGSLYGESLEPVLPLVKGINNGGIPCEATEEIGKALWAKMIYNCTLNPLGALLNVNYGKLTENNHSVHLMNKIIEEIFQVMKASGFSTYWEDPESYKKDFYGELVPSTYNHKSSTLQDIERKIKTEIENLTGVIVRLGGKFNVAVPYNEMIYNMIKSKESFY